jgi:hypothetical protein
MLSHSVVDTPEGGAIVFVWLSGAGMARQMVDGFSGISPMDKGDIFVQYCFLNAENTYFSNRWWCSLPGEKQRMLKKFAEALYYDGGKFVANHPAIVNWSL